MADISVVGSINLDMVVRVERLPLPGQTVIGSSIQYRYGGKGANQAVAAATLGAHVAMTGAYGDDVHGPRMKQSLVDHGVDVSGLVQVAHCSSGVAMIVVDANGENTVTVSPGANDRLQAHAMANLRGRIASSQILMLQMEVPLDVTLFAGREARAAGLTTVFNSAPLRDQPDARLSEVFSLADILVVNSTEAQQIAGAKDGRSWEQLTESLQELGPKSVVITLGAQGAVASHQGRTFSQGPFEVDSVDSTGAGDVFCGALATALARGSEFGHAVRFGCAAGALAASKHGAQDAAPNLSQVNALLGAAEASHAK